MERVCGHRTGGTSLCRLFSPPTADRPVPSAPSEPAHPTRAWSCDGKKLAAVGIDRMVRVFQPEKSVRAIYGLLPICFEADTSTT